MKGKRAAHFNIINFLALTVAGIINAFGVTVFLAPVKLYDSGISGTSMLLSQITPLSLSVFLILFNVPLFLYGLKKQGAVFTVYSIYTVGIYSLFAYLITDIFPIDVTTFSPVAGDDLLLCALFGGIVLNSWVLPLYSIVTYGAGLKVIDFIVEGIDRNKGVMIITEKADEVSEALIEEFESGTTKIDAKGGYSNSDKTVIYFVVNRFQISRMRDIVHEIDPKAFMTISEVADVFKSVN